jgi:outer membrane protein assembly factor BamB
VAVLIGSSFFLWRDVSDTHLYLYAIAPASGHVIAQQDLGGGYQSDTTFTNPVQGTSSLLFGVQTGQSASGSKHQLFSLTGNASSWNVESQFPAPLEHGTLALTPGNRLVVVHADGLQLMTTGGQTLWHVHGDEPTLGTHPFQPAFFGSMLFAVKSAFNGVVASFDLQSGAILWSQKLDDTLEYASPFLLYGKMLYIAADHTLYALDSADGTLLWKAERPARTLLTFTATQPLLLVAGPQGLAALNAYTGAIVWIYNGLPLNSQSTSNATLVPAQFYQANIASSDNVIYATSIIWDTQQVREQLWLFAIDAATGNVRWSEPVGSDFTSADAGRVYAPLVDTTHRFVILQQAQNDGQRIILAYNTGDGAKRWSVKLAGINASAPALLQVSNNALIMLNTQSSRTAALHNWSPLRMLLIVLAGLSVLCLLLLLILPFKQWIKRLHAIRLYLMSPFKLTLRLWHNSCTVSALVLLLIPVLGGVLLYGQLARSQNYLNLIAAPSGYIQWQHSTSSPVQLAMADLQGSIAISSAGKVMHQLAAFSSGGALQWTSFASEGVFSLPTVPTPPETVLVALSGRTSLQYQFAPDDPSYMHPLDSLYTLYLMDRQTGQIIWQTVIISPEGQQDTTVLGADAQFFYVASRATNSLPPGTGSVVQLVAVDKTSGTIVWRIFGPRELVPLPPDYGSLLMQGRSVIWQVSNTIYDLDTTLGQIQWRKYIAESLPQASLLEEAQMAEAAGVLLVTRSDAYHALDLATGNERWVIASPGNDTAQIPRGVASVNNIFLLYGGGTLQAVDPTDQHSIWSLKQLEDVQSLKLSHDGTLIYAILIHSQSGRPTTQVLEAIDVQTGTVRWTFQPFEQERFVNVQSGGFQYRNNMLFTTVCSTANQTSCDDELLYAINARTGAKEWKFDAHSIYNVHVSDGGDIVAFQTTNSVWGNLTERFR